MYWEKKNCIFFSKDSSRIENNNNYFEENIFIINFGYVGYDCLGIQLCAEIYSICIPNLCINNTVMLYIT